MPKSEIMQTLFKFIKIFLILFFSTASFLFFASSHREFYSIVNTLQMSLLYAGVSSISVFIFNALKHKYSVTIGLIGMLLSLYFLSFGSKLCSDTCGFGAGLIILVIIFLFCLGISFLPGKILNVFFVISVLVFAPLCMSATRGASKINASGYSSQNIAMEVGNIINRNKNNSKVLHKELSEYCGGITDPDQKNLCIDDAIRSSHRNYASRYIDNQKEEKDLLEKDQMLALCELVVDRGGPGTATITYKEGCIRAVDVHAGN